MSCLLLLTLLLSSCASGDKEVSSAEPGTVIIPTVTTTETTMKETEDEPTSTSVVDNFKEDPSDVNFTFTQAKVCTNVIPKGNYSEFMSLAQATDMVVPALAENFVPQGMDFWPEKGLFIISGYFKPTDKYTTSVLLAVNEKGEFVAEYELHNPDGTPHTGHDGGVAITENNLYLSNNYKLCRIPLSELTRVGNQGVLTIAEEISVPVAASFCNYSGGILWVGEFYQASDYPLKGNHIVTTDDKTKYFAWSVGYLVDSEAWEKEIGETPNYALSIPEKIQGFTMLEDGRILMTQSYGRKNKSAVFVCACPFAREPKMYVAVNGQSVPLWCLDNAGGRTEITAIPMAEGCCAVGNTAYLLFESGAFYYRAYNPASVAVDPTDVIWSFHAP